MTNITSITDSPTASDGLIIDLSVIVRSQAAVLQKVVTYREFIQGILEKIARLGNSLDAKRIDMVADLYFERSVKGATRHSRGANESYEAKFTEDDTIPDLKLFAKSFLANDVNKTNLNNMICKVSQECDWGWDKDYCIIYGRKVWASFGEDNELNLYKDLDMLEEADNRLVCHTMNQINSGMNTITVRTVDSNVIVILLLVDFGTGKDRKSYSITNAYSEMGKDVCNAVMMFHALSGCDSCSAFFRQTKNTMFKMWKSFTRHGDLTAAFSELCCCPSLELIEEHLPLIEEYICHTYGAKKTCSVDSLRFEMFCAFHF